MLYLLVNIWWKKRLSFNFER